jgi:ABC-type uncharacterized transport system substrate-binding protein
LSGADPVEVGLVQSFSRPSGNLTGIYNLVAGLGSKHLDLLRELLASHSEYDRVAFKPANPNAHAYALQTQAAAGSLGLRLQSLTAHTEADLEAALGIMVKRRDSAYTPGKYRHWVKTKNPAHPACSLQRNWMGWSRTSPPLPGPGRRRGSGGRP